MTPPPNVNDFPGAWDCPGAEALADARPAKLRGIRGEVRGKFRGPEGQRFGVPPGNTALLLPARTGEIRPVAGGREGRRPVQYSPRRAKIGWGCPGRLGQDGRGLRPTLCEIARSRRSAACEAPGQAGPEGTRSLGWALRACGSCTPGGCGCGSPGAPRGRAGAGSGPRGRAQRWGGGGEGCDALTGGIPRRGGGGRGEEEEEEQRAVAGA